MTLAIEGEVEEFDFDMEIDLLDFVEQCRHLAKQALGKHAGEPASGGFARWVHVVCTVYGSKRATATVKRQIG